MLQNNNKKFIKTLSKNCLKANKIRNLVAISAIILTTLLFTSVTAVLDGSIKSIKEQQIRQSGSRFMMTINDLTEEESKRFTGNAAFSEIGKTKYLGSVKNDELKKIQADFTWADKNYLDQSYVELVKGGLPEGKDEILLDTVVLEMLGLPQKTGQKASFTYEIKGEARERKLTVAGIYRGDNNETQSTVYVSKALFNKEMEAPGSALSKDAAESISLHVSFPKDGKLKEKRAEVLREAGFNPDADHGDEGFVSANINSAYIGASMDGSVIAGAVIMILIIMLAGYLIISNIFRISVLKDMRMYGQLKTIGTSPKQLRRLLKRQANILNLIGIPLGLCLGYILASLLLPVVMKVTRYTDVQGVRPNAWVFLAAAVFTLVTVWISCSKPVKMMSKMSPVQALRYQGMENSSRKQAGGRESRARIFQMARSNITSNKGKTSLVVLSLSLSAVLFNSVLNFTGCFEEKTFVEGQSAADFVVSNISLETRGESENYVVPQEFLDEVKIRKDIEKSGASYCYQPADDLAEDTGNDFAGILTTKILTVNEKPYPQEAARQGGKMLYGFDPELFEKCRVVNGSLDMEKLESGRYIVEATTFINNNTDYDASTFTLEPGDKVKGVIGGTELEYEVLANVVVHYDILSPSSAGEGSSLILPSAEYLNRFPGKLPVHYAMDAKDGSYNDVDAFLKKYEESPQANVKYKSVTMVKEEFQNYKDTFSNTGIVLAVIFGVIGLLNLLNVTLTNAIARQREFAVMQSIGMTRRQLQKLFVTEGVMYSVISGMLSLILSALLSLTAVRALAGAYWFCVYRFHILPVCILIPVYIVAAGLIALFVDKVWNNGSVVERLRKSK